MFQKGHKINNGRKLLEEHKRKIGKSMEKMWKTENMTERNKRISKKLEGRKLSDKHKRNIGKAGKGRKNPHTLEWNKKISEENKGVKSSQWKGGISPENKRIRMSIDFRLWREAVFARDNWTCQKCKKRGVILHPHHIQNFAQYPELRFAIDNGITFCEKCHREFHKIYGKKNNNKEQIENFIKKD